MRGRLPWLQGFKTLGKCRYSHKEAIPYLLEAPLLGKRSDSLLFGGSTTFWGIKGEAEGQKDTSILRLLDDLCLSVYRINSHTTWALLCLTVPVSQTINPH